MVFLAVVDMKSTGFHRVIRYESDRYRLIFELISTWHIVSSEFICFWMDINVKED